MMPFPLKRTGIAAATVAAFLPDYEDPYLTADPARVVAVWSPLEAIIDRLENDGTVETAGNKVVFKDTSGADWYDAVEALRGVIGFHNLARDRYGLAADTKTLEQFANKLDFGSPVFESDIAKVRAGIASCKKQAMNLRMSQAVDLVRTVQLQVAFAANGCA